MLKRDEIELEQKSATRMLLGMGSLSYMRRRKGVLFNLAKLRLRGNMISLENALGVGISDGEELFEGCSLETYKVSDQRSEVLEQPSNRSNGGKQPI